MNDRTSPIIGAQSPGSSVEVLLEALMADQHVAYKQVSNLGGRLVETLTLPETNSSPLKIVIPNRKYIFQPSIFRGHVSFLGCNHEKFRYFLLGPQLEAITRGRKLPSFQDVWYEKTPGLLERQHV